MIDFTNMPQRGKPYAGANGDKLAIVYNDELYMLKFPSYPTKNTNMNYSNSCISEYIGCKIFESIGIPVQEVLLGTYTTKSGKEKVVVACKDFATDGLVLHDFASLKNQCVDSDRRGYGTDLDSILFTCNNHPIISREELTTRFWDMFIVDALIGNWDRHNGNWGVLYNNVTDEMTLAPVYDCGSSLFPQADEQTIREILSNQGKLNDRVFNRPTSAITHNGERINYFQFISSHQNKDCNKALKRISKKIDMGKIGRIIDETPVITDEHKTFLKTVLEARKEHIIDFSLKKLRKLEKQYER